MLTCPFEPPKPKTKHKLELESVAAYEEMQAQDPPTAPGVVQRSMEIADGDEDHAMRLVQNRWTKDP